MKKNIPEADNKNSRLLGSLEKLGSAAIAFSGGVDSTFLLAAATSVLGDKVLALTVKTPYIPDQELEEARNFCSGQGIRHRIIHTEILEEIMSNPFNRCYLCKKHVFSLMKAEAAREGIHHLLDGTNADDPNDYRPGMMALKELHIESPLLENGLTKKDIRYLSRKQGLASADKPAYACLLTRLPHNYEVKTEELKRIEKAELYLVSLGFAISRVRNHGTVARIEIDRGKIPDFMEGRTVKKIVRYFRSLGYEFVSLDLEGYRTGSLSK
ncbi:MAG: ATP-dependent sacrificial sulfur transferase LarE [Bacteroidales bacterium]|nr:ATP-dependent sacrificial sulfur transferase LarE [Bacteroidales bacterium]